MRVMSYLNITRFMPTLLDRKDRMSMGVGLEVRVPYTDHRLIDYVWNIPWSIKTTGDREKAFCAKPLKVCFPTMSCTVKSPYPKTHNPNYLAPSKRRCCPFWTILLRRASAHRYGTDPGIGFFAGCFLQSPLVRSIDVRTALFAYLAQVHFWLKEYNVSIR